ncbi:FG-GAP repeat domain-containing protein [Streptomyces sp. NPDC085479]|uniref:FG-GAP repeat domain-containing protein n=1 Tax=Streptomyces sp. NPDC085479 TaxID=3365726 RepID=UPI0037CFC9EA
MALARSPRRRLTAAVATVVAATVGAGVMTVPAHAASAAGGIPTAGALDAAEELSSIPDGSVLEGVGVTGFLVNSPEGDYVFRRYGETAGQTHEGHVLLRSTRTTDFLVSRGSSSRVTQRNLTTNGSLEVPVGAAAGGATFAGAAGGAVFTTLVTEAGTVLRKHTEGDAEGAVATGIPAGATSVMVTPATPGHAKVTFGGTDTWALLDLATNAVTEVQNTADGGDAISATHTAWTTDGATGRPPRVIVTNRVTGAAQDVPVAPVPSLGNLHVGLVGDWVVYGQMAGMGFNRPSPHHAMTAYNLSTRKSVKVLDHAYELASAPDGSLYARGGLVGKGEGVYRIGAGGTAPKVEKIATTGAPTEVTVTKASVPPQVLDLDKNDGFTFQWHLSRYVDQVKVTVRHTRTGKTQSFTECCDGMTYVAFGWRPDSWDEEVHNGDYTWELTGVPENGIGPSLVSRGAFKVVRKAQPHDFNDNGSPDLITRDTSGRLWRTDLIYRPIDTWGRIDEGAPKTLLGSGWNVYDRIEAAGNLGGSAVGDLLARDKSGVLWLYQGNGTGNFATRVKVGGGWQVYDTITAGGDLTGDGRTDALATDTSGTLWLYPGTGNAKAPFTTRKKIGGGWAAYNDITAIGNLAGGPAGDLVARDKAGVLWLYLGKGDGTFAPRTRIGAGWGPYDSLIGAGDADGDGRPDLIATDTLLDVPKLYKGSGDWRRPFRNDEKMYLDFDATLNLTL